MDDITKGHLEKIVGAAVARIEKRLDAAVDVLETRIGAVGARVDSVETGLKDLGARIDRHHGETMRKFQAVITEAERLGAATSVSQRMAELEARIAKLEAALAPPPQS
jgi:prefoldin subunit 5